MARIDHGDLTVGSLDARLPFYRGPLGPLGRRWVPQGGGERGETIHYLIRRDGRGSIGLRQRQSEGQGAYDRYTEGLHHLAINVGSRRAVRRAGEWARQN